MNSWGISTKQEKLRVRYWIDDLGELFGAPEINDYPTSTLKYGNYLQYID